MSLIKASNSVLLVVDIQEKLAPHIDQGDVVTENTRRLMRAALALNIPVIVTEHYSDGLGRTVMRLQDLLPYCDVFEKIFFSAALDGDILQRLQACGRQQIILTGSETHVCVMQTALGLSSAGFTVCIVDDATSSRNAFDRTSGIKRLNQTGINSLSTEMLLFEWLESGDNPAFKQILALIKNHSITWKNDN